MASPACWSGGQSTYGVPSLVAATKDSRDASCGHLTTDVTVGDCSTKNFGLRCNKREGSVDVFFFCFLFMGFGFIVFHAHHTESSRSGPHHHLAHCVLSFGTTTCTTLLSILSLHRLWACTSTRLVFLPHPTLGCVDDEQGRLCSRSERYQHSFILSSGHVPFK